MYISNISFQNKKVYELSKDSNITTNKMKSECISKKHRIPIKCKYISTKNQKNKEKNVEMEIKILSKISSYRKGKYIYSHIGENKWDNN